MYKLSQFKAIGPEMPCGSARPFQKSFFAKDLYGGINSEFLPIAKKSEAGIWTRYCPHRGTSENEKSIFTIQKREKKVNFRNFFLPMYIKSRGADLTMAYRYLIDSIGHKQSPKTVFLSLKIRYIKRRAEKLGQCRSCIQFLNPKILSPESFLFERATKNDFCLSGVVYREHFFSPTIASRSSPRWEINMLLCPFDFIFLHRQFIQKSERSKF